MVLTSASVSMIAEALAGEAVPARGRWSMRRAYLGPHHAACGATRPVENRCFGEVHALAGSVAGLGGQLTNPVIGPPFLMRVSWVPRTPATSTVLKAPPA
jgi:hypothetical protein